MYRSIFIKIFTLSIYIPECSKYIHIFIKITFKIDIDKSNKNGNFDINNNINELSFII